jgi:hypothetical protein
MEAFYIPLMNSIKENTRNIFVNIVSINVANHSFSL